MTEESFGGRLRRERERRHIALSTLSANTKISVSLFEGLEREDLSRWPPGIFRRAFIRAYADGIGLDAEAITREFLDRFPDPLEPATGAAAVVIAIAVTIFVACGKFWLPLAVTMLGYYLGGILLLGNTPGVCLWAPLSNRIGTRVTMARLRSNAVNSILQLVVPAVQHADEDKEQPPQMSLRAKRT